MIETIGIHRGRNSKSIALSRSITKIDYNFDFRGFNKGSILNPFWLLLKAWITSKEIPESKNYLIEGGMLFWVGFFLKKRYPKSNLLVIIHEPAFYLDERKSFLQKVFFNFRMKMMKNSVKHFFVISKMVEKDAKRFLGQGISTSILKCYIENKDRFQFLDYSSKENNILYVIERPADTGYVKGLNEAIKIFEELYKLNPKVKLFLAGSGTEYLKFEHENIICLGYCNIEEIYKKVKIIIAPARYDAFVMTVPEASLCGVIPLVSHNVGSQETLPSELIIDLEDTKTWVLRIQEIFSYSTKQVEDLLFESNQEFSFLEKDKIIEGFKKDYFGLTKNEYINH